MMGFGIQIAARERRGNALDLRQVEQHRELPQVAAAVQWRRQRMQAGVVQRCPDEIAATVDGDRAIHIEFELGRFLGEVTQAATMLLGDSQGAAVIRVQMLIGIIVAPLCVLHALGGFTWRQPGRPDKRSPCSVLPAPCVLSLVGYCGSGWKMV